VLAGAAGFTASSRTAKACSNLNALLYADAMAQSLDPETAERGWIVDPLLHWIFACFFSGFR
jgi:hypothetical protein